jgi:hypothetical protein
MKLIVTKSQRKVEQRGRKEAASIQLHAHFLVQLLPRELHIAQRYELFGQVVNSLACELIGCKIDGNKLHQLMQGVERTYDPSSPTTYNNISAVYHLDHVEEDVKKGCRVLALTFERLLAYHGTSEFVFEGAEGISELGPGPASPRPA